MQDCPRVFPRIFQVTRERSGALPPRPATLRDAHCLSFFGAVGVTFTKGLPGLALVLVVAGLAACTQPRPKPSQANVNLAGFPPTYKQGYVDGCATSHGIRTVRDEAAFKADFQYASGWRDGRDICKKR